MISPSLSLGLTLGLFYGAAAHLILGGDARRLVFFIIASILGFALGQALGQILSISAASLGPTHVLSGSLGSLIAISSVRILIRRIQHES